MAKNFITKTIILVSFVSLFTDIASEMLYPVMPVFLKSIGFSVLLIGVLEGVAEATAGLSKGYFGNLSDNLGRRVSFIQWGYLLSAISKPMMALFTFPIWIFSARTIDRLGKGIRNSARDALLSDESKPETKGKVFGFHRGMDTLGAAIGPILALIYLYFYPENYKWLFVIAFAPGLIAVALTLFLKDKTIAKNPKEKNIGFFSFFRYWNQSPKNYKMLVIGLVSFTLFNSSDAFLLLMVKELGYSDTQMISLYIFYNLSYALLAFPMGYLADKVGMKKVLVFGILSFGAVYTLFGFSRSLIALTALFGLYSIYAASTEGISKAWISNIVSKDKTATAIGLFNSLQSVATLIASSLAGLIWFKYGAIPVFVLSGSIAIAVALYITFWVRWERLP